MFDVFGAEMPLAVRFFLAFLIVLGLIGATAWAVRNLAAVASATRRADGSRDSQSLITPVSMPAGGSFLFAATMSSTS